MSAMPQLQSLRIDDPFRSVNWPELFAALGKLDGLERLTTLALDRGDQVFVLESEIDELRVVIAALRESHPGIVLDSSPHWFDSERDRMGGRD